MIEKFRITRENIYNFDKKKFLIDIDITLIQVITYKELKSDKIIGINQDSNRKWLLLLIAIYIIAFTLFLNSI